MIRGGPVNISTNIQKSRNKNTRSLYAQLLARIQEKNRLKSEENKAINNRSDNIASVPQNHVAQPTKSAVSPLYSYAAPQNVGSLNANAPRLQPMVPTPSSRLQFPSSNNHPVRIQSSAQYFRLLAKKKGIKIGDDRQLTPSTSSVRPTAEIPSSISISSHTNEINMDKNVISDRPISFLPNLPPPPTPITFILAYKSKPLSSISNTCSSPIIHVK